jgi:hypothetical protein
MRQCRTRETLVAARALYYVHELDDGQHTWADVRRVPLDIAALAAAGWRLRFVAVFDSARKAAQFARTLGDTRTPRPADG